MVSTYTQFQKMHTILPDAAIGVAQLRRFELTEFEAKMGNLQAAIHGSSRRDQVEPGTYMKLLIRGQLVMSDTQMEERTSSGFLRRAHGRVLVAGLGMGATLSAMLPNPAVESVTVVEVEPDVIELVAPHLAKIKGGDKLTVIQGDARTWKPERGTKFNSIWLDIWPDMCPDHKPEMRTMKRRYRGFLDHADPARVIDVWALDWMR